MRQIILDLAVSLDGYIEGPNGEIDWCIMDDDMDFEGFLSGIDALFYGRVSYDMWGNFQPEANADEAEHGLWKSIHAKQKYVFSGTKRTDKRAIFITGEDLLQQVKIMRQQEGKDIWLYGGAGLIKTFIHHKLIDVYRISVHPVVLGAGIPLFDQLKERINLELTGVNRFRSGVVQLIYTNAAKQ